MKLIVDASAAASWLLASQSTTPAKDLLDRLGAFETSAPHVFQWEIGNLLCATDPPRPGVQVERGLRRSREFQDYTRAADRA